MVKSSFLLSAAVALILSGCVSGPSPAGSDEPSSTDTESPPSWVSDRPEDDARYKYFVGTGTSQEGDTAEARRIAAGDILSAIQRFIGVDVSVVTIAENRATLDSFQADITQTLVQEGAARVAGFEIVESWADRSREPAVTLYLLARYEKGELLEEKRRQEELLEEELEAIAGPEREGKAAASDGRYYDAARSFLTAASNALNSDLPNADIRFKRNIDQAAEAVQAIQLLKITGDQEGLVGRPLADPLRIKAAAGPAESAPGIPDVTLRVSYRELHAPTGRIRPREAEITTDEEGYAVFTHPVPSFVGTSPVIVSLLLNATVEGLSGAPASQRELVDRLEQAVARKRVRFTLTFTSNAKEIRTGVLSIDYRTGGEIAGLTQSASGLRSALHDFNLASLTVARDELAERSDLELVELLRSRFSAAVDRIILASVRIVSTRESGGRTLAKASGTVQVLEVETGAVLYTARREKNGLGVDAWSAAANAYTNMGQVLGEQIRNNLR